MGVSREVGGLPELTAVVVIATGVTGAVLVTPLMDALGIRDWRARGFAPGLAAHGNGTARALPAKPVGGPLAGLARAPYGVGTALGGPVVLCLFCGADRESKHV